MPTLLKWYAKRAGGRITITHSTGKVAGIDKIEPRQIDGVWQVVAISEDDGVTYILGIG